MEMNSSYRFGYDRPPYTPPPPIPMPRHPSPKIYYDGPRDPRDYNPKDIEPGNTGILLNNKNYQVADIHIPGSFSEPHSLTTKSKGSPVPDSQVWTILRVANDNQAAIYYNVPDGSVTWRLFAIPTDHRTVEIHEGQTYIWTVSVAKDDRSGKGYAGKSVRIYRSVEGVDLYWTLDPDSTSGKVILAPWNEREPDSQTWTVLREVDTKTFAPQDST